MKENQLRVIEADFIGGRQCIIRKITYYKVKKCGFILNSQSLNIKLFEELGREKNKRPKKMIKYIETADQKRNLFANNPEDNRNQIFTGRKKNETSKKKIQSFSL